MNYILILGLMLGGFLIVVHELREQHEELRSLHAYTRQIELKNAELQVRLDVFEEMRIRIDVIDHTGIWVVGNATEEGN